MKTYQKQKTGQSKSLYRNNREDADPLEEYYESEDYISYYEKWE